MARRRRPRRSFAGARGGRQYWWLRYDPFALTLRGVGTALHSDILLAETDYQNPTADLNSTQKGGARLERLIIDYGLSVNAAPGFFTAGGSGQIALIPEFMIWKQSTQFDTIVTNTASWEQTRQEQRIIMNDVPGGEREFTNLTPGGTNTIIRSCQGHYETKSKVRLADSALGIGWRGFFATNDANLAGYTDWVRPTMLISVP